MLTACVSGSFHRHLDGVYEAVKELKASGVDVLSPRDPRVVDARGEFLFVASDLVRSVYLVQDRHLRAIKASDFLWLVTPDGYVGQSASMEIGFAVANGIPIFGVDLPYDMTLRQYVRRTETLRSAIQLVDVSRNDRPDPRRVDHLLIDPHLTLDEAENRLAAIRHTFDSHPENIGDPEASELVEHCGDLQRMFGGIGVTRR